jgi:hypothetical protein
MREHRWRDGVEVCRGGGLAKESVRCGGGGWVGSAVRGGPRLLVSLAAALDAGIQSSSVAKLQHCPTPRRRMSVQAGTEDRAWVGREGGRIGARAERWTVAASGRGEG